MYNLRTTSSFHVAKPAGTYVYDIVPVAAGLAAISSDDSLRLLDPLALNAGPVNEIKKVNADVTCLKAVSVGGEGDAVVVCTAGRDGRVALWDPRSGAKVGEVRSGELGGSIRQSSSVLLISCRGKCVDTLTCLFFTVWFGSWYGIDKSSSVSFGLVSVLRYGVCSILTCLGI